MYDRNSPFVAQPTTDSTSLEPRQKTEFAEDRLTQAILWCELMPGSCATEVDLSERFGLGRAAIRAALLKLSAAGLVQPVPRLGWRVLPMTGALIGNVISARRLTEPSLADASLNTDALFRVESLASMIAIIGDSADAGSLSTRRGYERELLSAFASFTNPIIASFLVSLWDQSDRIVRFLELGGATPMGPLKAETLIEAVSAGDRNKAGETLLEHLDRFQSFAGAGLLKQGSELALEAGDFQNEAAPIKRTADVPANEQIRVSRRGRPSRTGKQT